MKAFSSVRLIKINCINNTSTLLKIVQYSNDDDNEETSFYLALIPSLGAKYAQRYQI